MLKEMISKLENVQFLSRKQALDLARLAKKEINNNELNDDLERQIFNIKHASGSTNTIFNIVSKYVQN